MRTKRGESAGSRKQVVKEGRERMDTAYLLLRLESTSAQNIPRSKSHTKVLGHRKDLSLKVSVHDVPSALVWAREEEKYQHMEVVGEQRAKGQPRRGGRNAQMTKGVKP
jgi:hypothetical protein